MPAHAPLPPPHSRMSPRLTRPRPSSSPPCLFAQHGAKLGGETNLSAGLQVAGLALKHRQNKNQRQRIVVFVGSPVKEEEAALVKLGKKLKKNSVAVDIVNFGEDRPPRPSSLPNPSMTPFVC